ARDGVEVNSEDGRDRRDARALAGDEVTNLPIRIDLHVGVEDLGVRLERRGELARELGPARVIERERLWRVDVLSGRLLRERRRRLVLVLDAVHLLRALLEIGRERLLVLVVGEQPERISQRGRIAVERPLATNFVA